MNDKTQAPNTDGKIKNEAIITDPYHILLAEDDMEMRALLARALIKAGYKVTECHDGVGLLTHLGAFLLPDENEPEDVDLIISDIRMPGFTGMELLEGIPKNKGYPPIILITAFGDKETHARAEELGAVAMFDKPFDVDDLLAKVQEFFAPNERNRVLSSAKENSDFRGEDNGKTC